MQRIRAIYDGKTFLPEQPVSLTPHARVTLFVDEAELLTEEQVEKEMRAYYAEGEDEEDREWATFAAAGLRHAWEDEGETTGTER